MTIADDAEGTPAATEENVASPSVTSLDRVEISNAATSAEPEATEAAISNQVSPSTVPASQLEIVDATQCLCFPHGFYSSAPAILSTFGWFVRLSQDGCDYSRLTGPIVTELTNDSEIPFIDAGFNQYRAPSKGMSGWYIDFTISCEDYNTDVVNMGANWTFAKTMGFLSLLFGGAGSFFLWFTSCFALTKTTWRWAGYELLFASCFQVLTFSWFGVDMCHGNDGQDKCTLGYGSKADILALACWLLSAGLVFAKYPSPKKSGERNNDSPAVPTELEMVPPSTATEFMLEGQPHTLANTSSTTSERAQTIPEMS